MLHLLNRPGLAVLLSIAMAGAAASPAPAQQDDAKTMLLVMKDGLAPPSNQWDIHVYLGAIPGKLMGSPQQSPPFLIPAAFGKPFTFPTAAVARALASQAEPAPPRLLKGGLTVQPAATRYLRVATFLFDKNSGKIVTGGGMRGADGTAVMLAYFDRACLIQGIEEGGSHVLDIKLVIPGPGLHWLRSETITPDITRVTLEDPAALLQFEAPRP